MDHFSQSYVVFCREQLDSRCVQVARVQKMLGDEFGTASNIKNRVNRQSVLGAITSAQQRLKLYNKARFVLHTLGQLSAGQQKSAGPH